MLGSVPSIFAARNNNATATDLQQLRQVQQPAAANSQGDPATPNPSAGGLQALQPQAGQSAIQQQLLLPSAANNPPAAAAPPAPGVIQGQGLQPVSEASISDAAFNSLTRNTLPMTPEQIIRLRQLFAQSQLAAATLPWTPPRPVATSQLVNLAPGATPPVVRLQQGFVSSLVFIDSTGAPWPIDNYDVGNPSTFNIQWNKSDNTLMIQPNSMYTFGNLAVRLRGLVTPVMLTLIPGQQAVDYRVDMRIQGIGPNATHVPTGEGLPPGASQELLGVLEGVPPAGSKMLNVVGGEAQVWTLNNFMYVRTRMTIISPAWIATMSSADGMKAYQMQVVPMLLVSAHGKTIHLKIEGI